MAQKIIAEKDIEQRQSGTVEKDFRAGGIKATIWKNQIDEQRFSLSVSLDRSYMDAKGEWQTTKSLRTPDVPKAIIVLQKAYEHMVLKLPVVDE